MEQLTEARAVAEVLGVVVGGFMDLRVVAIEELEGLPLDGVLYHQKVEGVLSQRSTVKSRQV